MIEVYDIETLASCFTYTGYDIETKELKTFVIHKDKDESKELYNHLKTLKHQVGYNNVNFDYPIIHRFIKNFKNYISPEHIINDLYTKAQEIISKQDSSMFTDIVAIKHKEWLINQVDLFKIWHYNNPAKRTSLKALQISMNYPNVMESKVPHTKKDITLEEVKDIVEYNVNDVMSTYEFFLKSKEKIKLRNDIQAKYNLPCINWNNGKIGEQLILKLYCEKVDKSVWDIKPLRTYRPQIHLKECVPQITNFKNKEFQKWIEYLESKTITHTKGAFEYSVIYKGHKYDMGLGGEHGFHRPGVYESNSEYIIKSCDVQSLHPNLPLIFKFYPKHLGPEFLEVYGDSIVKVRLAEKAKPKKEQNKAIVDGYKEAANVPYGKSNEANSFLYDPLYTMKTTIASQVVLSMLAESLSEIPDSQILLSNTDGLEILIPKKYEYLYEEKCKSWETLTGLILEFSDYQKIWAKDINNYGCLDNNGKIKNKGCFEVDKVVGSEPAYHKDNSFRIIPLALQEYFTKGVPVEDTIINNTDIYNFCGRQKFNKDSYGETHEIKYLQDGNPYEHIEKQQRNVRYYIKNEGKTFLKVYNKGTSELINKGYQVEIFNKFIQKPFDEYDINYSFYIKECYKIIEIIEPKQIKLWV